MADHLPAQPPHGLVGRLVKKVASARVAADQTLLLLLFAGEKCSKQVTEILLAPRGLNVAYVGEVFPEVIAATNHSNKSAITNVVGAFP